MGVFAYIKNGVKYKTNQFPGAYPANRVSYNGSDVETALDELNADITNITKIKSAQITADIPSSGIVNLRTDGKPVVYVTTAIQGWYYVIGTSDQIIWTKVFNYNGTVISDRTGIIFYYYYLDL